MTVQEMQEILGWTDAQKSQWIENNSKYYEDIEQAWADKLKMHINPPKSAAVYVMPAYQSPITGKWIDTPAQRRDDMARSGSRPWEGMEAERKVASERVHAEEKAKDQAIENAVVGAWHSLSDDKKATLENSL